MKTFKLAALAVATVLWAVQVHADHTNLVQNLSIQLFGFSQGGSTSFGNTVTTNVNFVRVDTRQVIQALALATANSFSSTSKLAVVTPLGGGDPSIQVRDGANPPVDVTSFFNLQQVSGSVGSSIFNARNSRGSSVSYDIDRFALQDADGFPALTLHFDVNGFTVNTFNTGPFGGSNSSLDASVSGSGDRNGNLLILQGSVGIFGRTLEVVPDGGVS